MLTTLPALKEREKKEYNLEINDRLKRAKDRNTRNEATKANEYEHKDQRDMERVVCIRVLH